MTLAMVKVLPLPVTPSKTWSRAPFLIPDPKDLIASGWSPEGRKFDLIVNCMTNQYTTTSGFVSRGCYLNSDMATERSTEVENCETSVPLSKFGRRL